MKTHTTAGEELLTHAKAELGESGYLNTAVEMAAYHHEWWNGKGYPYGISGEEIPLCARIMAVADVFDALTSKRCYKNAMPLEKAYSIIREESGTSGKSQFIGSVLLFYQIICASVPADTLQQGEVLPLHLRCNRKVPYGEFED